MIFRDPPTDDDGEGNEARPVDQGRKLGRLYIADVLKQGRVAIGPDGKAHDMLELAAEGFIPDDLAAAISEMPDEIRHDFEVGFRACLREWVDSQPIGASEN